MLQYSQTYAALIYLSKWVRGKPPGNQVSADYIRDSDHSNTFWYSTSDTKMLETGRQTDSARSWWQDRDCLTICQNDMEDCVFTFTEHTVKSVQFAHFATLMSTKDFHTIYPTSGSSSWAVLTPRQSTHILSAPSTFTLTSVGWFWGATQTTNIHIFQHMKMIRSIFFSKSTV